VPLFGSGIQLDERYVQSLEEFMTHLKDRYQFDDLLNKSIPWRVKDADPTDRAQLVLAGGCPLNCLHRNLIPSSTSDLDFFPVNRDTAINMEFSFCESVILEELGFQNGVAKWANQKGDVGEMYSLTTSNPANQGCIANRLLTVTPNPKSGYRQMQFVAVEKTRFYQDVILRFDNTASQVLYDGTTVFVTRGAIEALRTRVVQFFLERQCPYFTPIAARMRKLKSMGFSVTCRIPDFADEVFHRPNPTPPRPDFTVPFNRDSTWMRLPRNGVEVGHFDPATGHWSRHFPKRRHAIKLTVSSAHEIKNAGRLFIRLALRRRFRRLARISKTEAFAKWFYAPENPGGQLAKREISEALDIKSKRRRIEDTQ
jgi:hypothetical protein